MSLSLWFMSTFVCTESSQHCSNTKVREACTCVIVHYLNTPLSFKQITYIDKWRTKQWELNKKKSCFQIKLSFDMISTSVSNELECQTGNSTWYTINKQRYHYYQLQDVANLNSFLLKKTHLTLPFLVFLWSHAMYT